MFYTIDVYFKKSFIILYVLSSCIRIFSTKSQNELFLSTLEGKIVGGHPVKIESFPFSILFFNGGSICSGVILNSLSILTAAHCFQVNKNLEEMEIAIGSRYVHDYDAEIFEVLSIVIHEDYNKIMPFASDIALIFLKESIKFDEKKQRAVLVSNEDWMKCDNDEDWKKCKDKDNVVAAGWGWTKYGGSLSELGLLQTTLRYVPRHECEKLHGTRLAEDMFCLYGDAARDTCRGDSGGGVLWNGSVIGIVSHGNGCAKKDKPSVYISVYYHRQWIERHIKNFIKNYCKLKSKN
ncbi:chymotrypsin-1-like [Maniola hyperantus]|uniref:chymotrypsin-1-like n=1 Tax=Aphantopus hyperantus TaxID=2795564 RepID=UPI00156977B8|nr:chymotrypsin-1-like [Maniola hyperantus]